MSRGERKGLETTKENSENEPLEIAETIEYFEEDEKTFQKPLDKYIKVWYNIDTKEREELLMRVTKLIREYVEKTVKAMPKFANLTPEEVAYKEMVKKVDEFRNRMNEELKVFLNTAIGEFCEAEGIPDDVKIEPTSYNTIIPNFCISQIAAKARTAERKRNNDCKEAIDEILLSLELGADRKELEDMLNTLREEA